VDFAIGSRGEDLDTVDSFLTNGGRADFTTGASLDFGALGIDNLSDAESAFSDTTGFSIHFHGGSRRGGSSSRLSLLSARTAEGSETRRRFRFIETDFAGSETNPTHTPLLPN
jgi:hypothetical protein